MMKALQIFLFGSVRVIRADQPSPVKVTRIGQALLAYLSLYRQRSHPRELLVDLFWGNYSQKRARRCLNTALWRLRRVLDCDECTDETYLLTTSTGDVRFNTDNDCWLDVAIFEKQAGPVLAKPIEAMDVADAQALNQTLQLHGDELLPGFYDDWVLRERERLRRLYLNGLAHLMRYYHHHGAFEEGLACGQQILNEDPLREEIHREMMRLYLENGQQALALRQYERCCQVLVAELGISPMAETRRLHTQIVAPSLHNPDPTAEPANSRQLQRAVQTLKEAQTQLQQAIRLVERIIKSEG